MATVNQKLETLDQKMQSNASDIQNTNAELNGKITNSETTTNQNSHRLIIPHWVKILYGQLLGF